MTPTEIPAHCQDADAVVRRFGSDATVGLSTETARQRLDHAGPNALPTVPRTPWWQVLLGQFRSTLVLLLLLAGVVSCIEWVGTAPRETPLPYEAIAILAIVVLNAALGAVQEVRADQAVRALDSVAAPQATVVRDGFRHRIPACELVTGDIIGVETGDIVPADARLCEAADLALEEASLTGESLPAAKNAHRLCPAEAAPGDRCNMLFSGTHVVRGRGSAIVTATGAATEVGKIAGLVHAAVKEPTPLEREMDSLGRRLSVGALALCGLIFAGGLLQGWHTLTGHGLWQLLLFAVALAVAAVPEALPAVVAMGLAVGTRRMAVRQAVVRRLPAVETMGAVSVICTDKTGTLTQNVMVVRRLLTADVLAEITGTGYEPRGAITVDGAPLETLAPAVRHGLEKALRVGALANDAVLQADAEGRWRIQGDPMEGALLVAYGKLTEQLGSAPINARFPRRHELAFTSERRRHTTVHTDTDHPHQWRAFVKGGADALLPRCTAVLQNGAIVPLSPDRRQHLLAAQEAMSQDGLRVLALAEKVLPRPGGDGTLPADTLEEELVFLGAVGIQDPPRPEARAAVETARQAGVRTVMITGDHPATAAAIAREVGILAGDGGVLTGAELDRLDEKQLDARVDTVSVYARVEPAHKLRIVGAWQRRGHIVAMTGDGVNDAPALRTADVGVAMGGTGTDVAREAADVVLVDDNFATMVAAIAEGRAAYANIQRYLTFLLAGNAGEILTMLAGMLFGAWFGESTGGRAGVFLAVSAVQLLFINLVTDGPPALALGLEPLPPDAMRRPARLPGTPLLDADAWKQIAVTGLWMTAGIVLVLAVAPGLSSTGAPLSEQHARTLAFTVLVLFQLANALSYRSSGPGTGLRELRRSPMLLASVILSALAQVAVVQFAPLRHALGTVALPPAEWILVVLVGCSLLVVTELWAAIARAIRRFAEVQPASAS